MIVEINESISVIVKFEKGRLIPLYFFWRNRNYRVEKVEFVHFCLRGGAKIFFFSVMENETNYELIFNSQNFNWQLGKIETL